MALFNFGKKKEEEKKTPACACSCGCAASEAESITNDCCPDLKEGEICCIKVLGAGCKSCHEQFEYTKQAVKDMGLSVEVEYITDMQKVMEYGVMSMPALVVNEKVVAMGKVLKAADVVALLHKLGAGCKSCHEQFEYTKQAVKDMGLSVEVEYITDMQKVMEYGVMSMPALVVNEKVVAMGKVLKAADVVALLHKLGF